MNRTPQWRVARNGDFASGPRWRCPRARSPSLLPPAGEHSAYVFGDAGDLGHAAPRRLPADTERPGQFGTELRLVEKPGRALVSVEVPAVQGSPTPVPSSGEVGDQNVGVQLRVAGSAGAVPERSCDEPVGSGMVDAVASAASPTRLPLQVPDRRCDRCLVRGHYRSAGLPAAEGVEQRDRLGRRERQVEPGYSTVGGGQAFTLTGRHAREHSF